MRERYGIAIEGAARRRCACGRHENAFSSGFVAHDGRPWGLYMAAVPEVGRRLEPNCTPCWLAVGVHTYAEDSGQPQASTRTLAFTLTPGTVGTRVMVGEPDGWPFTADDRVPLGECLGRDGAATDARFVEYWDVAEVVARTDPTLSGYLGDLPLVTPAETPGATPFLHYGLTVRHHSHVRFSSRNRDTERIRGDIYLFDGLAGYFAVELPLSDPPERPNPYRAWLGIALLDEAARALGIGLYVTPAAEQVVLTVLESDRSPLYWREVGRLMGRKEALTHMRIAEFFTAADFVIATAPALVAFCTVRTSNAGGL